MHKDFISWYIIITHLKQAHTHTIYLLKNMVYIVYTKKEKTQTML